MLILPIKKRQEILESRKNSIKTEHGKYITLLITPIKLSMSQESVRFLAVVSKKVDKRAVIRNKIRRQIKEIFRQTLTIKPNYDYQIIAKNNILTTNFWEIKKDIEKALSTL